MKKYVRVTNDDKLQKTLEALGEYLGGIDESWIIRTVLTLYAVNHIDGYNPFTGDVAKKEEKSG